MEDRFTFGKQMCLFEIFTTLAVCQSHCPYPNWWIKQANMPRASQFTAWHLSMQQPPCVCLCLGLLGCLWLGYVLLSGRLGRNNPAEKWGLMAPQHKFLEVVFQSKGGTQGATQVTQT